jgi:uncharacterized protein (DUF2164 family)
MPLMRLIMAGILVGTWGYAAGFNATDSFINVPIAKQYRLNEIQFGFSQAYNGSPSIQDDSLDRYELDFKMVYAINHRNQVALNLVNPHTVVVHYQHTVTDGFGPYQLALGIRNMTEKPFSTWGNDAYVEEVNMSPFIVNSFYGEHTIVSVGYGIRGFMHPARSLSGIASFFETINGVFFGFSYNISMLRIMAEYDGRDVNMGVTFQPTSYFGIHLGITELFLEGDTNPQHMDAPRRVITLGVSTRNLFSHHDHLNKQIRDLNIMIGELEQRELKRIEAQKKSLTVSLISPKDALESEVVRLYSESLEDYNRREYGLAIQKLQKALALDPTNSLILSRLGSVYYTYGFKNYAKLYWKKALSVSPDDPNLQSIRRFVN